VLSLGIDLSTAEIICTFWNKKKEILQDASDEEYYKKVETFSWE
jgi:hypothetical protein